MRVLIVPGTSEAGLEIHAGLRFSRGVEILSGSTEPLFAKALGYQESLFVPSVYSPDFLEALQELCINCSIDAVLPAHDEVAYRLRGSSTVGTARVVSHSPEFVFTVRSKRRTYERLIGVVETPRVVDIAAVQRFDFPLFAKPDEGQGSRGATVVESFEHLEHIARSVSFASDARGNFLLSEFIEGSEVTVDCFSDTNGGLVFAGPRERTVVRAGISVYSSPVVNPLLIEQVRRINDVLRPTSAWFAQFRIRGNVPVLMEVGPRIAGSSGVWRLNGVNLAEMTLHQAFGKQIVAPTARALGRATGGARQLNVFPTGLRFPERIAFDFDDVVVMNNKLNGYAVALAALAQRLGIPTVLISRHPGDLLAALERFNASGLFGEVVHLRDGGTKASHVKPGSWFFDDSFSERQAVLATNPNVLALDASAIPSMLHALCDLPLRSMAVGQESL
jgi:carbamoyl-phosphate synthase large subunit